MIVVDTSAVIEVLAARPARSPLRDRLETAGGLHAPHLLDVEVLQVLRGLVAGGKLSLERAMGARWDFDDLVITRYPHAPLRERIWELRDNLTAYDAAFVALAEALDAPLVTTDRRLARSPGHEASVELYAD